MVQGKAQMYERVGTGILSRPVFSAYIAGCPSGVTLTRWAQEMKVLVPQGPDLPVWRRAVPALLPTRCRCSLGWCWHFLNSEQSQVWSRGLARAALLSCGDLPAPGPQRGWLWRSSGDGGDTARGAFALSIPFCFPFHWVCCSWEEWSFTTHFCCNLHVKDNTAHLTQIPHQICERTVIYELHDSLQWIRSNVYMVA